MSLPKLPSLPKIVTRVACECGCGTPCGNRFAPGHDAKLLGYVKRVAAGVWDREAAADDTTAQLDGLAGYLGDGCAKATAKALGVEWTPKAKRTAKAS